VPDAFSVFQVSVKGERQARPLPPPRVETITGFITPVSWREPAQAAAARSEAEAASKPTAEQRNIARFVASKYRLTVGEVQRFVEHAYQAAREFRLDPFLVLAVVSVESSFNPNARSPKGAQGLMQVLTRVHTDKFAPFGGPTAAFDPMANLIVGSRILKEYIVREGSVQAALKSYVGAATLAHDYGYGNKVLHERAQIAAAAEGASSTDTAPVEPTRTGKLADTDAPDTVAKVSPPDAPPSAAELERSRLEAERSARAELKAAQIDAAMAETARAEAAFVKAAEIREASAHAARSGEVPGGLAGAVSVEGGAARAEDQRGAAQVGAPEADAPAAAIARAEVIQAGTAPDGTGQSGRVQPDTAQPGTAQLRTAPAGTPDAAASSVASAAAHPDRQVIGNQAIADASGL
jgi:hypothetical protein